MQKEKTKINCLKFIIDNSVVKEGFTDFQLAEQLHKWIFSDAPSRSIDEQYSIVPGIITHETIDMANENVQSVLKKINQDPERMKVLSGISKPNASKASTQSKSVDKKT